MIPKKTPQFELFGHFYENLFRKILFVKYKYLIYIFAENSKEFPILFYSI